MALSKRMKEAIELLKKEEFYLHELPNWSAWRSYNLNKHIRTDTMKALERRGIVKISTCSEKGKTKPHACPLCGGKKYVIHKNSSRRTASLARDVMTYKYIHGL